MTLVAKFLAVFAAVGFLFLHASAAKSSQSVAVSRGPDGGWDIRIGGVETYVIPIGGGIYWVGTPRDYDIGRATRTARDMALRPSIVADPGYAATFVGRDTIRITFPGGRIDGFQGYMVIGKGESKPPRPRIMASQRYVGFLWIQSPKLNVQTRLIDLTSGLQLQPISITRPRTVDYNSDEYALDASAAGHRILLLVSSGKSTRGVSFRSAAWVEYLNRVQSIRNSEEPPDVSAIAELSLLRKLDQSVPRTYGALNPSAISTDDSTNRTAERPLTRITLTPPPSQVVADEFPHIFIGSIDDNIGGKAPTRVTILRDHSTFNGSVSINATTSPVVLTMHGTYDDGNRILLDMEGIDQPHCRYHGEGTLIGKVMRIEYRSTFCPHEHSGTISVDAQ